MSLPSRLQLPPGPWATLLDGLCARFPRIARAQWQDRFARGRVLDAQGRALTADMPWQAGLDIQYFREVADEPVIPFAEAIVHQDAHLLGRERAETAHEIARLLISWHRKVDIRRRPCPPRHDRSVNTARRPRSLPASAASSGRTCGGWWA